MQVPGVSPTEKNTMINGRGRPKGDFQSREQRAVYEEFKKKPGSAWCIAKRLYNDIGFYDAQRRVAPRVSQLVKKGYIVPVPGVFHKNPTGRPATIYKHVAPNKRKALLSPQDQNRLLVAALDKAVDKFHCLVKFEGEYVKGDRLRQIGKKAIREINNAIKG